MNPKTPWWLVAALALIVSASAGAQSDDDASLRVRAFVSGSSVLTLTSDQVQWLHRIGRRPGESDGEAGEDVLPTVMNGAEWLPGWIGSMSLRYKASFALPDHLADADVRLALVEARGELVARKTDTTVLVEVDDTAHDGGAWYEFEIRVGGTGGKALPLTKLPGPAPAGDDGDGFYLDRHADRQARQKAQQQLSGQMKGLESDWLEGGLAKAHLDELAVQIGRTQAQLAHWNEQVLEAEDHVDERQRDTRTIHGVTYDVSYHDYWYRVWRARLADRRAAQGSAERALDKLLADQEKTLEIYREAGADYAKKRRQYDADLAGAYEREFAASRQALAAGKVRQEDERTARVHAGLTERNIVGRHTLIHSGRELGTVQLHADHSITTVLGERRPDYQWEIVEDGLLICLRDIEWLLVPTSDGMLLGTCLGPYPETRGVKALLRRE